MFYALCIFFSLFQPFLMTLGRSQMQMALFGVVVWKKDSFKASSALFCSVLFEYPLFSSVCSSFSSWNNLRLFYFLQPNVVNCLFRDICLRKRINWLKWMCVYVSVCVSNSKWIRLFSSRYGLIQTWRMAFQLNKLWEWLRMKQKPVVSKEENIEKHIAQSELRRKRELWSWWIAPVFAFFVCSFCWYCWRKKVISFLLQGKKCGT